MCVPHFTRWVWVELKNPSGGAAATGQGEMMQTASRRATIHW